MNEINEREVADVFSRIGRVFSVLVVIALLAAGAGLLTSVCGTALKLIGVVQWKWLSVWLPFLIPFAAEIVITVAAVVAIIIMSWLKDKKDAKANPR